jgi:hypothetical protein
MHRSAHLGLQNFGAPFYQLNAILYRIVQFRAFFENLIRGKDLVQLQTLRRYMAIFCFVLETTGQQDNTGKLSIVHWKYAISMHSDDY